MADHDYNRRIAEALGIDQGFDFTDPPGSQYAPPDYRTDWSQLPAILAALQDKLGSVRISIGYNVTVHSAGAWRQRGEHASGDTLLLAAGALLLKLKEASDDN